MSAPIRQHIIPRFYLNGFADPNDRIWVYDLEEDKCRCQTPHNTGVRRNYYTATGKDGEKIYDIEEFLAYIEGLTSPVIKQLEQRCYPTPHEAGALCYFISYMFTRVPAFRDKIGRLAIQFTKEFVKSKDPGLYEELEGGEFNLEPNRNFVLAQSAELGKEIAHALGRLQWQVLLAPKEVSFVTSDNPVSIHSHHGLDSTGRPLGGILEKGCFKVFPLTSKACLFITDSQTSSIGFRSCTAGMTRTFNRTIGFNAYRYIYARDELHVRHIVKKLRLVRLKAHYPKAPGDD